MVSTDITQRLSRYEIPGRVTVQEGNGELPKLEVTSDWSTAEIYLHGAHVTDFQRKGEPPLLFLSQCSRYAARQRIRGGIPVIFPWFGAREGEPMHGYARLVDWALHETTATPDGGVSVRFNLPPNAECAFGQPFSAYYVVTVTAALSLELILTNLSPNQELSLETCLHTYFQVGDIEAVSVHGLKGVTYLDKVDDFAQKMESADSIRIGSEVDRIYLDTTGPVEIHDRSLNRRIRIEKSGSASTVVWNPWTGKAQQMPDFGNDEFRNMLCVESGNVARNRLTLPPGQTSVLKVVLTTSPESGA